MFRPELSMVKRSSIVQTLRGIGTNSETLRFLKIRQSLLGNLGLKPRVVAGEVSNHI